MTLQKFMIKGRFHELRSRPESHCDQLPAQTQAFMSSLIQLMELIIIVFEEHVIKKNSHNSGLPPFKEERRKATSLREQQEDELKGILKSLPVCR